jgi:hypothetical protein
LEGRKMKNKLEKTITTLSIILYLLGISYIVISKEILNVFGGALMSVFAIQMYIYADKEE